MGVGKYHTGMFHGFPNATITPCLQLLESYRASFSSTWVYVVRLTFRCSDDSPSDKHFRLILALTDDHFVHVLVRAVESSHRYNFARCINPLHIVSEPGNVNKSRAVCYNHVKIFTEGHYDCRLGGRL
ncbi:hypothetical protein BKA56DRAFT_588124 [Ilyonectria sp. MPI-CAGE-AT-0026]|nr:hypothetical protein BKA56DRAFT_588124 [Ilyonectria sp. MPI-CAGE-AT-0026]